MAKMGTSDPEALRATVITSYAMSSIMTGLVFFGLGAARLGALVSFFPHSILTGCIGGVGIFLFVTGEYTPLHSNPQERQRSIDLSKVSRSQLGWMAVSNSAFKPFRS